MSSTMPVVGEHRKAFRRLQSSEYSVATFLEEMKTLPNFAERVDLLSLEYSKGAKAIFRQTPWPQLRSARVTEVLLDLVVMHSCESGSGPGMVRPLPRCYSNERRR